MSRRRNIDEDAVPASGGTAPWSMESYNDAILAMKTKSRKQIDRMAQLATFADQMERHLEMYWLTLEDGNASDKNRGERVKKLIDEYRQWRQSQ